MVWARDLTWRPELDASSCSKCGACVEVCPNSPDALQSSAHALKASRPVATGAVHFISHDADPVGRTASASGGTTTVLLTHLLQTKTVDCVIAIRPRMAKIGEPHFEAVICRDVADLQACRSSAYGPVRYDEVLRQLAAGGESCAMTVLPCVQRAVDRLPVNLRERIKYTVGIVCSHNVTDQFGDFLARRHGVGTTQRFLINYRDKRNIPDPSLYNTCFKFADGREIRTPRMANGFTPAWRNYWFAQECCLYCPDFYVNGADIAVKDAWGRLAKDPRGLTLCVVRNLELCKALRILAESGKLHLTECNTGEFVDSQPQTAVYKQVKFIRRWRSHPMLKDEALRLGDTVVFGDRLSLSAALNEIFDYHCKLITLRVTKRVFTTLGYVGCLVLNGAIRVQSLAGKAPKAGKRLRQLGKNAISRTRRAVGLALRLVGLRAPARESGCRVPNYVGHGAGPVRDAAGGQRKPLHVLVTGGYGYGNVGDEAQLGANITRWRALAPDCELKVFSPNPAYTSGEHKVESIWAPRVVWFDSNRKPDYTSGKARFQNSFFRIKRRMVLSAYLLRAGVPVLFCTPAEASVLDAIQWADVLHISGGGFLTGMTRSRLWENCLLMRLCHLLGTPVILSGQTIGVWQDRRDRRLAKWGLAHARIIQLRDVGFSQAALKEIGITGTHVSEHFDDALFCGSLPAEALDALLAEIGVGTGRPFVAVNFHHWKMSVDMAASATKRFAELCDYMAEKYGYALVFVPMHVSDVEPQRAVMRLIKSVPRPMPYQDDYRAVRGVFSRAAFLLTMKHHPIIFAQGEGVPAIAVAVDDYYKHKNSGALAQCGQENYCMDYALLMSDRAFELIDKMHGNLDQERRQIQDWLKIAKTRPHAIEMFLDRRSEEKF